MASTAPAKSQPLHNFDLPHLKWKKDGTSTGNHQRRRSVNSPSRRPNLSPLRNSPLRDSVSAATPPYRQSPLRDTPPPYTDYPVRQSPIRGEWSRQSPIGGADSVPARRDWAAPSESETSGRSKGSVIGYRKKRNPNPNPNGEVNFVKKSKVLEVDSAGIKRSSKIKIKIPGKSKPEEEEEENHAVKVADHRSDEGDEVQEEGKNNNNNTSVDEEAKTWNLRPRKPMSKKSSLVIGGGGGGLKNHVSATATALPESSSRNLNHKTGENEGNGDKDKDKDKEKEKEKRKLSINIALTKEEIEEDFFGWTGAKPPRRPKKRPKNIQKQLDFVFPGLWLVSITPDSYKVSENYMKG